MPKPSLLKFMLSITVTFATFVGATAQLPNEPIAYIGHGAMFDQSGREIPPTPSFILQAQTWYLTTLRAKAAAYQRAELAKLEQDLSRGLTLDQQSRLVLNTYLIDWLLDRTKIQERDRIRGKNNLMRFLLQWKLSEIKDIRVRRSSERFVVNPTLAERLKALPKSDQKHHATPRLTDLGGEAYRNLCRDNRVPIPPDFGPGTGWTSRGVLTSELFIVGPGSAEVLTWESTSPAGLCVALPRFNSANEVTLDGVICVSQETSQVCFWDNQKDGVQFTFPRGTARPFTDWGGGSELRGTLAGVCSDCHAGENPFIVHPDTDALGALLDLPTFPPNWYDPIVTNVDPTTTAWPENPGPMNSPASCEGCHYQGFAGRFPHISTVTPGYCGTVLRNAIARTMPPTDPGSLNGTPEMENLLRWCGEAASGDAAGRGDPHLTSFDGVNFDFQGSGEFVYLRSARGLEIQARHAAVPTAGVPPPNPYTGLASCVSVTTAIAARVGRHRVTFQPRFTRRRERPPLELRIDKKLEKLGDRGIILDGGGQIVRSKYGEGIEILFPDRTRLIVVPGWWASQNTWYLNVDVVNTTAREGVLGAILPGNWLPLLPGGRSLGSRPASLHQRYVDLNQRFADSWRVTSANSLFDYVPGTSTLTFTTLGWPPETGPCRARTLTNPPSNPMDRSKAEEHCKEIRDTDMRAQCVFDVTVTGEPNFAQTYLITQRLR